MTVRAHEEDFPIMDAAEAEYSPEELQALRDADPTKVPRVQIDDDERRDIVLYRIYAKSVHINGSVFISKIELDQENGYYLLRVVRPETRPGRVNLKADGKSFVVEVFPYHYTADE